LDILIHAGIVEVLRPVPPAGSSGGRPDLNLDLEYYRWVRPTDQDYMWQNLLIPNTPSRPAKDHRDDDLLLLMNS
jgi:hypothetical protein